MKIDGKVIAHDIKEELKKQVFRLRRKNIIPHLAVILVGNDPSSLIYIKQKKKLGEEIGVKISIYNLECTINKKKLANLVNKLNKDKTTNGIIIQRPVPFPIEKEELDRLVTPRKDVDGFHPDSPFTPPVAAAVIRILTWVYSNYHATVCGNYSTQNFNIWLKKQKILVIGRGETAGRPIAEFLRKNQIKFIVAHSQTTNIKQLCLSSGIIISAVGKPNIVRPDMVTAKTILIGVGLHPEEDKLQTDYNQEEIAGKVAFYTPVPGGVGPVNVACLFENLIKASSRY